MALYPFYCPECLCAFEQPEPLGVHLERHRPAFSREEVDKGKGTSLCPGGCGRYFGLAQKRNVPLGLHEHVRLCNGAPPLEESSNELKVFRSDSSTEARIETFRSGLHHIREAEKDNFPRLSTQLLLFH